MRARFLHVGLAVLVCSLAPGPGRARAEDPAATSKVTVLTETQLVLRTVVKAEFAGASVGQALALCEKAVGGRVQFIVNPGVRDIPVPTVRVSDTTLLGVWDLLCTLVPDLRLRVRYGTVLEPVSALHANTNLLESNFPNPKETVVVLADLAPEDPNTGQPIERKLRVFRIGDILTASGLSVDDLATAIETVWQVEAATHAATLKFHKETGLLICSGTPRHVDLVEQVLEGVTKSGPLPSVAARVQELETRLGTLQQAYATVLNDAKTQLQNVSRLETRIAELERSLQRAGAAGSGK